MAEKAGVRVGDVVWKVDGEPLGGRRLASALTKASHVLHVAYMKGDDGQAFEVPLPRPASGGIGIKVDGQNVVSKLQPGGPAAADGRLRVGDRIISVNSVSLRDGKKLVDVLAPMLEQGAKTLRFKVLPTMVAPGEGGGGGRRQQQQQQQQRSRGGGGGGFGGFPGMGGMGGGGGVASEGSLGWAAWAAWAGAGGIDPEMLQRMMGGRGRGGGGGRRSSGGAAGSPALASVDKSNRDCPSRGYIRYILSNSGSISPHYLTLRNSQDSGSRSGGAGNAPTRCQRADTNTYTKTKIRPTLPVQHGAPRLVRRAPTRAARRPPPRSIIVARLRLASASASAASSRCSGSRAAPPAGAFAHDTPPRRWRALTARRATA